MKFSVLMSVYAGERPDYLRRSLQSVFLQTLMPDEVVMVEDGPLTNPLYAVIQEFQQDYPTLLKRVSYPQNRGIGYANNVGLQHCSYDIVAKMDTDDVSLITRFEEQMRVFEQHPELDLVGAWITEFDGEERNVVSIRKVPEKQNDIKRYAQRRCPINHPAVMYRKQSVMAVGGYGSCHYYEDYELSVRMLMHGCRFYNLPKSLLLFRYSKDMMRRRGGLSCALVEVKALKNFYQIGFFSLFLFLQNLCIRFSVRLLPLPLRSMFYRMFMRSANKT